MHTRMVALQKEGQVSKVESSQHTQQAPSGTVCWSEVAMVEKKGNFAVNMKSALAPTTI